MSRYKQLSDAYAVNTQALIVYRQEARDALTKIRDAVRKHLGLIVVDTDIVRIVSENGSNVFSTLAVLEHGESVHFELVVSLGGDGGLPKSDIAIPAVIGKKSNHINLSIPGINFEIVLDSDDRYQAVAESVFEAILSRLEKF
ncbi:hypothetical protein SAMN04490186_3959 [Pseudomonas grimontii]|jgi:hypothetical protein|uniref:Uncharacterized protein n=1 Tax=Pseudomonas grimontii TaxID=129847 RepID=A0A1H1H3V7_9PSED|nr:MULTISPECIES: hypothetical protein [Pseudomonas]QZP18740.1 hypothetical protein K5K89_15455 [Pseudomonas sp. DR208]TWR67251.1 hypothetical protein FIV39_11190 [Pseudomonas grimontii]SDR20147.1 hypothetical protein SAMN04490186_3959 [Pseudomonas grimontii]